MAALRSQQEPWGAATLMYLATTLATGAMDWILRQPPEVAHEYLNACAVKSEA